MPAHARNKCNARDSASHALVPEFAQWTNARDAIICARVQRMTRAKVHTHFVLLPDHGAAAARTNIARMLALA